MREPIPVMPSSRWAPCVGLQIDVCGQACVPLTSLFQSATARVGPNRRL